MNTLIKNLASRGLVYVLAVAILGTGFLISGDNNAVEAEKLSSVYLTNKATGLTTEASPPSARTAPASRKNASTVYVTMSDVNTGNVVQNSHIINANKVVITIDEPDHNTKVAVVSGNPDGAPYTANNITNANWALNSSVVLAGVSNSPVIDSDSDGDLTDEISVRVQADGAVPTFDGSAFAGGATETTDGAVQIVSVGNGSSSTSAATPMITILVTDAYTYTGGNTDDVHVGYYTSAVNTFQVEAWSTVQLASESSKISVVETGRNTGIFEAEFLVSDTEGVNDNLTGGSYEATTSLIATGHANLHCGTDKGGAVVADGAGAATGRFDKHGGTNADCEFQLHQDFDLNQAGNAEVAAGTAFDVSATLALKAGEFLLDEDGDGDVTDSIFFDAGSGTSLPAGSLKLFPGDGTITVNTVTCSAGDTTCKTPHTAARTIALNITVATGGEPITNGTDDLSDVLYLVGNNVVDNQKVDTDGSTAVNADDLKTGRIGSDTISGNGTNMLRNAAADANNVLKSGVLHSGQERTPIVEAQANSTITVQYTDLTDNSSSTSATVGTKVKATVTVDTDAPSPIVSTPAAGSSFKDRQPVFTGSASDIGAGLDVSTVALYVDINNDTQSDGLLNGVNTVASTGPLSFTGGAAPIDLMNRYKIFGTTLDNTATMVDGIASATWSVTTSKNIPCTLSGNDGTSVVTSGAATHTNFGRAAVDTSTCTDLANPDVVVDYFTSATDLAGNRGFSDGITSDTDAHGVKDPYTFNVDEDKPELVDGDTETGVYYDPGTFAEKTGSLNKMVVAFDDEIATAPASSFKITTDAGTVITPSSAEVGTKGTNSSGASYDFRKNVYLTLPSDLASSETPKVQLVGDVTDLAGNSNKADTINNAIDKIKPTLTLALSGGSGTGTAGTSNDSDSLTKSAMTMTITTSEVLSGVPVVKIFSEDYGTGATYTLNADAVCDINALDGTDAGGAGGTTGDTANCDVVGHTVIDTDKDGSFLDEVFIVAHATNPVTATVLAGLTVTAVTNGGDGTPANVRITVRNASSTDAVNGSADQIAIHANVAPVASTSATTDATNEGTVTAVAQDSKTFVASFAGTSFSDAAAKDSKAVIVEATDVNGNTGKLGNRDQSGTGSYVFRLDKTAPTLNTDPDGDLTVGSTTTLPRPYVIFEFSDNSDVTVNSASFGGDDVLAKLATTNNKKYFMVPDADLEKKTYVVKAKGTDVAGNKGTETSYNYTVSSRKDYQATILAGWNLMSFPSNPTSPSVGTVFTNGGIDQVVAYDAMAKGSPWSISTRDSAAGSFSGSLSNIESGNGYWVHSTEFSTQKVTLTGPEGPSASAPPTISSIALASGWNLVGVVDATKQKTEKNEGACLKTNKDYLGADGGSSVTKAYEYNTTSLAWSEINIALDVACGNGAETDAGTINIGEAFWVYAKPDANGLLTPIVP